ncbi:hypothetical protein F5Y19DRAFT_481500 [Xylariaceae sp. FL1651]|nr:hypothetical protein F5Y19DRAFT_481500 [Xylariaceae sp. FL1651]
MPVLPASQVLLRAVETSGGSSPGVSYHAFLGVIWALTALTTVFLALRLQSRYRGPRRLFWDDGFAIFAWSLALATAILWQVEASNMYYSLNVAAGLVLPGSASEIETRLLRYVHSEFAALLLYYSTICTIKLSYLFFFHRLGSNIDRFNRMWWPILLFVLATYFIMLGTYPYACSTTTSIAYISTQCDSASFNHYTTIILDLSCVLDVVSDFLILIIPFTLLWNVRIRRAKKVAFLGIFSVSVITMVIAIVRTADANATKVSGGQFDPTFLYLWSAVEACVAIIVSCLSAFPQLFAASPRDAKPIFTPSDTYRAMMSRIRARRTGGGGSSGGGQYTTMHSQELKPYNTNQVSDSGELLDGRGLPK